MASSYANKFDRKKWKRSFSALEHHKQQGSSTTFQNGGPLFILSYAYEWAFWPESLKVRILLYFAHANKVKMANYNTYKRI